MSERTHHRRVEFSANITALFKHRQAERGQALERAAKTIALYMHFENSAMTTSTRWTYFPFTWKRCARRLVLDAHFGMDTRDGLPTTCQKPTVKMPSMAHSALQVCVHVDLPPVATLRFRSETEQ